MLLKKIVLNNIRSYENQEIEFPEGATLLSGDIGAGKTSILLGIEFALFGLQPGQKGSSLLKNGKDEGGVIMEFQVDDKNVMIERNIKKGKSISQTYCAITINNEKKELSVTELKNKVLELLGYPLEFSKKQNILYKFTVYTPQEEMKQIILQDSETRLNTLRHVFGIDKYKRILENALTLTSKLREEKRMKEGLTANLDQDKSDLLSKENELETKYYNLNSVEKELFSKTEDRKKIQEEKVEISKKIEEKIKFQQEIEKTKIMIANKKDSRVNNNKIIVQLELQIKEFQDIKFDDAKSFLLEKEIKLIKEEIQELNETNLKITSEMHSLSLKNQDNDLIKEKISKIEICPTCLQDVDPIYKSNVLNKMDSNTSENTNKIKSLTLDKKSVLEKINNLNNDLSLKEKQVQELSLLRIKCQEISEKQKNLEEMKKSYHTFEKDIELLEGQLQLLKNSVFEFSKFDNIFEELQKQLDQALNQEKIAEIKVAELRREIQVFSKQIEEIKDKISKTLALKYQLDHIIKLENWLSKQFIPVISFIEKNVMIRLKAEFSKLFSEWFSMLVSDVFEVSLSDDFTPIIEQQDYEIDYNYLSGGERTAIALAYRLSLNQVINSLLSKIKTRDLVILDEPTDGFSEQQLDKMRDVLQELNVKQLIIVSHEQKIEGFVDNIVRFKKEGGISKREG